MFLMEYELDAKLFTFENSSKVAMQVASAYLSHEALFQKYVLFMTRSYVERLQLVESLPFPLEITDKGFSRGILEFSQGIQRAKSARAILESDEYEILASNFFGQF